jgi:hypothetical protein
MTSNAKDALSKIRFITNFSIFLVGLCVGIGVIYFVNNVEFPLLWFLVFMLFVIGLAPMCVEWRNGTFDLFNIRNAFVGYYIILFGIGSIWAIIKNELFLGVYFVSSVAENSQVIALALLYSVLGLVSFYVGYYLKFGRLSKRLPYFFKNAYSIKLWMVGSFLIFITAISSWILIERGGGLIYFINHIDEFRTSAKMFGSAYLYLGISLSSISLLLFSAHAFSKNKNPILIYLFFLFVAGFSLFMGFRIMLIFTLVYLLIPRHYLYKRIRIKVRYVLWIILFIVTNSMYVLFRQYSYLGIENMFYTIRNLKFSEIFFNTFFARFHGIASMVPIIKETPSIGFNYGKYFILDLVTGFIPRMMWPDKPLRSVQLLNQLFYSNYIMKWGDAGAIIPTFAGELYWIAGVPGILIGMFLMGIFSRMIYSYLINNINMATVSIYAVCFWFLLLGNETFCIHSFTFITTIVPVLCILAYFSNYKLKKKRVKAIKFIENCI